MLSYCSTVETVVLLYLKNVDIHINVNVELGDDDGKILVDKIAEKSKVIDQMNKLTIR